MYFTLKLVSLGACIQTQIGTQVAWECHRCDLPLSHQVATTVLGHNYQKCIQAQPKCETQAYQPIVNVHQATGAYLLRQLTLDLT